MKWLRTMILFDRDDIAVSAGWKAIHEGVVRAITAMHYPEGSGSMTLRRKRKGPGGQWERNGVAPLKAAFLKNMRQEGWQAEGRVTLARLKEPTPVTLYPNMEEHLEPIASEFGPFDFVTTGADGLRVVIEWETGNISSSHRSLNKLALAVKTGIVDAAVTIVPSRPLYDHLTDRIGNINELSGYLPMWKAMGEGVERGLLAVVVVEQDALTDDGEYLRVGTDGRAAQGKAKQLANAAMPRVVRPKRPPKKQGG